MFKFSYFCQVEVQKGIKNFAIAAEDLGTLPGRSNRTQCRQRLAIAATFLRVCVAQDLTAAEMVLATRNRFRRHVSENNEDLIF